MKIPLTLNKKKVVLDADPSETLLNVLRREKLFSVKCGCEKGVCGACMVLLDGRTAPSCIIPAGIVRESSILTLEAIRNDPLYDDIMNGFNQAGIHLCGYCNAGKILTAYEILTNFHRPAVKEIHSRIQSLDTCCTDEDSLTNAILYAVAFKHSREAKNGERKK